MVKMEDALLCIQKTKTLIVPTINVSGGKYGYEKKMIMIIIFIGTGIFLFGITLVSCITSDVNTIETLLFFIVSILSFGLGTICFYLRDIRENTEKYR